MLEFCLSLENCMKSWKVIELFNFHPWIFLAARSVKSVFLDVNVSITLWFSPSATIDLMGIVIGHCICLSVRPEGRYRSNSLRISAISLNLVGWCTVPWSRLLRKMAMLSQFLHVPRNFANFNDRLGPGRWNWGNHIMAWNLVLWCSLPWNESLFEMATLSYCSHFLISERLVFWSF